MLWWLFFFSDGSSKFYLPDKGCPCQMHHALGCAAPRAGLYCQVRVQRRVLILLLWCYEVAELGAGVMESWSAWKNSHAHSGQSTELPRMREQTEDSVWLKVMRTEQSPLHAQLSLGDAATLSIALLIYPLLRWSSTGFTVPLMSSGFNLLQGRVVSTVSPYTYRIT